ncbi:MAG: hypothetical protein HHJ15_13515 [Rhodoferax sp.]|uniref:hypothetical protein n=1 Tax=Rhodoferax sp. TaxID=50421 RepID=UPI00184B1682|nr:hypothetical protein [Rhodoferax sp.]NMM20949.1 hypothetical protein [Rhodoferax sp.]
MRTQEQDVVTEQKKLVNLKSQLLAAIKQYIEVAGDFSPVPDELVLDLQQSGNAYFNHAEQFVGSSGLLGAHSSLLWVQGFAEDCSEILASMPSYYELLRTAFQKSPVLAVAWCEPGETAFANMQRMVMRHLNKEIAGQRQAQFENARLPTYGFKNMPRIPMNVEKVLAFLFGVSFIIVLLVIALVQPTPTSFQATVFRTVLSLAAAGVAAVIPGFLNVQLKLGYVALIRAGGAIAVFVLVYFNVPA